MSNEWKSIVVCAAHTTTIACRPFVVAESNNNGLQDGASIIQLWIQWRHLKFSYQDLFEVDHRSGMTLEPSRIYSWQQKYCSVKRTPMPICWFDGATYRAQPHSRAYVMCSTLTFNVTLQRIDCCSDTVFHCFHESLKSAPVVLESISIYRDL